MNTYELNIKKILEVLLKTPHYLTLDQLSKTLAISKRSVQNYLVKVEDWFAENGLAYTSLIKKQGHGIMLETSAADNLTLQKILGYNRISMHSGDAKRRMEITKKLLFSEDELTISHLSQQFHVSRSVIICDLEWVGQWLSRYKLMLFKTQHKGIGIIGNEIAHRNAIAGFFDSYEMGEQIELVVPMRQSRLQEKNLKNLIDVYPRDHVLKIARIIEEAEEEYDFFLMEDYYISLLTHIVISMSRIISGNPVKDEFLPPDEKYPQLETDTANYIAGRIQRIFNIEISQSEKDYICIHLVGYNAFSVDPSVNPAIPQKIENLALSLIESVDAATGGSYIRDKMLFFGLCFHLISTVYRLQKGIYHTSMQKTDLPQDSVKLYDAVKQSATLYKRICDAKPDDDEILHVTYYFLLSKRRNMRRLGALLVSNQGIATRMELHKLIEDAIARIDVVDNCSTHQLQLQPGREYDFIITTESLENKDKPIVDISRLARNDYVRCIEEFLTAYPG